MAEETAIGIITAFSALIEVYITQKHEQKKRISEEKRWYADHFLDRKIDSIANHYSLLMDWYFSIQLYGSYPPSTLKEYKTQFQPKEEAYLKSLAIISVYFNENEYSVMTEALGKFRQATIAIWLNLPDAEFPGNIHSYSDEIKNIDWIKFEEARKNVEKIIKTHLNPEILQQVPLE